MKKQFEVDKKACELVFTDRRIDIIEAATGKSIVGNFFQNGGMVMLADLRVMFIQGLKYVDGGYVPAKVAEEAFTQVINEIGYATLSAVVIEALQEDCPFLFRES